jgi:hypothetical protein
MRGVLIYVRFDLKHIQPILSNIKKISNVAACCQGGDEPKKLSMILGGKSFRD